MLTPTGLSTEAATYYHVVSGQTFEQLIDFKVESVKFDPNLWLAAKNEVTREDLFTTGIKELNAIGLTLFPNPAANSITIVKDNTLTVHYDIKDVNGKVVKSGILNDFTNNLDIVELPVGTYIFALQDDISQGVGDAPKNIREQLITLRTYILANRARLTDKSISYIDTRIPGKLFVCSDPVVCQKNLILIYGEAYK